MQPRSLAVAVFLLSIFTLHNQGVSVTIQSTYQAAPLAAIGRGISVGPVSGSSQNSKSRNEIDSFKAIATPYHEALSKANESERAGRSAHYNENAPSAREIWEDSAPQLLSITSHVNRQALPIRSSDAIVLGTVTEGLSLLSSDRKNIYSEFRFQLKEVIKTTQIPPLSLGRAITIENPGGAVQLPSGKIVVRGDADMPPLLVGGRYVLFLKHMESTRDFTIENGYLLEGQTVRYLDDCFTGKLPPSMVDPSGNTPNATTHPAGSPYAGTELQLLDVIRRALLSEKKGGE